VTPAPTGFDWTRTKDGRVRISHHGRVVTTLAGARADRFLARAKAASAEDAQHLMARATGNYRHGNERG
jgi:hypothetical protein